MSTIVTTGRHDRRPEAVKQQAAQKLHFPYQSRIRDTRREKGKLVVSKPKHEVSLWTVYWSCLFTSVISGRSHRLLSSPEETIDPA